MIVITFQLIATAFLPVAVSALLYYVDSRAVLFQKIPHHVRQLLYGLIFGITAICGTEFGVNIGGAIINVRDAGPLCAGLIFGGPAGILAGIIGGLERWFCVYWGGGEYTRLACTTATVLAGFFGAALRHFIFDDKKPSWMYGLLAGIVMEIVHMLLIFITNMSDIATAFSYVERCSLPMIFLNSASVTFAVLTVSHMGRKKLAVHHDLKQLSQTFQRWLASVVTVTFLITMAFSFVLQTELSRSNAENLLSLNIRDLRQEIADASDENLLKVTGEIAADLNTLDNRTSSYLKLLCYMYDVSEINFIDENGIISASSYADFIGFDMKQGEQSSEFLVLLEDTESYVQPYGPVSYDPSLYRKYAGVRLNEGGFLQVGYDADQFHLDMAEQVAGITRNRHIGETGSLIIADTYETIVSDRHGNEGESLDITGFSLSQAQVSDGTYFDAKLYGVPSYCLYVFSEGYHVIAALPLTEAFFLRNVSVYLTIFMEIALLAGLFMLIYYLVKRLVVDKIREINHSLGEITGGNLDVVVDVRTNEEFASLSDDINSTVTTLKQYIAEAAARIDQELEFARQIQYSALPSVFPPYPHRKDFHIFAMMTTAKEVGGDFYDFYMVGEDRIAFLIADVSGKGIPAAMFMMTAKTLIKSLAEAGHEVHEVFTLANDKLCENNDADMFLTAWMGMLDLKTGHLEYANAGHNPPLISQNDGEFTYLRCRPNLVLAGMDGIQYKKHELQLAPGDTICLYTDGVTEAANTAEELYGEERLLGLANACQTADVTTLCQSIKEDVDAFAGDAPQFDDITILAINYTGVQTL